MLLRFDTFHQHPITFKLTRFIYTRLQHTLLLLLSRRRILLIPLIPTTTVQQLVHALIEHANQPILRGVRAATQQLLALVVQPAQFLAHVRRQGGLAFLPGGRRRFLACAMSA